MGRVHLLNRAGVLVASDVVAPQTSGAPPAEETAPRPALPQRPAVRRPDDVAPEPGSDTETVPRRRVRDRLARRIVAGQRSTGIRPVLEPLAELHPPTPPPARPGAR